MFGMNRCCGIIPRSEAVLRWFSVECLALSGFNRPLGGPSFEVQQQLVATHLGKAVIHIQTRHAQAPPPRFDPLNGWVHKWDPSQLPDFLRLLDFSPSITAVSFWCLKLNDLHKASCAAPRTTTITELSFLIKCQLQKPCVPWSGQLCH